MIKNNMRNQQLYLEEIYFGFHHLPAWLFRVSSFFKLTPDDEQYLEFLEDAGLDNEKFPDWPLDENELSKLISNEYMDIIKSKRLDRPPEDRVFISLRIKEMENLRKRVMAVKYIKKSGNVFSKDLDFARDFLLENLVELDKNSKTRCLWHTDNHPSFYVKNGWGYCFSCGESADSIKWVMKRNKCGFREAVNRICQSTVHYEHNDNSLKPLEKILEMTKDVKISLGDEVIKARWGR